MKQIKVFLSLFLLIVISCVSQDSVVKMTHEDAKELQIISFNLRYGGNWTKSVRVRSPLVIKMIQQNEPSVMGFQEATWEWMQILQKKLSDYDWVGVGRDDGGKKGEFAPIFYLKERFNLIEKGHFWLSEISDVPSLGWDAACPRIATWAILEEKSSLFRFLVMNTHLDHVGRKARINGTQLIIKKMKLLEKNYPIILTGDFNADEHSSVYKLILENLKDCKFATTDSMSYGTFHNYRDNDTAMQNTSPIDFIFVSFFINVKQYRVLNKKMEGFHLSDHYAVQVIIQIP